MLAALVPGPVFPPIACADFLPRVVELGALLKDLHCGVWCAERVTVIGACYAVEVACSAAIVIGYSIGRLCAMEVENAVDGYEWRPVMAVQSLRRVSRDKNHSSR
jgi:hypothetical protein